MFNNCNPCEVATSIHALTLAIAQDKTSDEIIVLATYFEQIANTLATIALIQTDLEESNGNSNCN